MQAAEFSPKPLIYLSTGTFIPLSDNKVFHPGNISLFVFYDMVLTPILAVQTGSMHY